MAAKQLPESDVAYVATDNTLLYWVAGAFVAIFLGLLIFGFVRGKRRSRSSRKPPESLGSKLMAPVRGAQSFRKALKSALRERARRNEQFAPKRPSSKR